MGRKKIYGKIKKNCIRLIIIGVLIAVPLILAGIFLISDSEVLEGMVCIVFGFAGIFALISGIYGLIFPDRNKVFVNYPDIIRMADELYSGIIYDDGKIIMSDRLIASKKDPLSITMINEVLLIYIHKQSVNFIPIEKSIRFECLRDSFSVDMSWKNTDKIQEIIYAAASRCPNARIGYTPENQLYLQNTRLQWQKMYGK